MCAGIECRAVCRFGWAQTGRGTRVDPTRPSPAANPWHFLDAGSWGPGWTSAASEDDDAIRAVLRDTRTSGAGSAIS